MEHPEKWTTKQHGNGFMEKCSWAEYGCGTWNGNFGTKEWNMKMAEQV